MCLAAGAYYFLPDRSQQEEPLGATIPTVVSLFETSLQSSITDSATSMTLVSGTDRSGTTLSGFMCFTIDEGTSVAEFVCGTASSTAVSGLTRGVSPTTGTSTVSSLKYAHRRGSSVKITNYPQLAIVSRILNGNETLPNPIVYDSSISTTTLSSNTTYLANVAYVNGVALQGAPTATGTTPGVLQLATRIQLSNGTAMSGPYTLVPSNEYFTYNPIAATSVPVSNASGKIAQGWFNLAEPWAFTASTTFTSTTTLAATTSAALVLRGIPYTFPTTQGSATSTLINNGSGNLTWGTMPSIAGSTSTLYSSTFTATSTLHKLVITPPIAQRLLLTFNSVMLNDTAGNNGCKAGIAIDNAATTTLAGFEYITNVGGDYPVGFSYLTDQLSAAEHTITVWGSSIGSGTCSLNQAGGSSRVFTNGQFSAFYLGN